MVRVRYAPSPSGELHLGSLRTVIFNYLMAKGLGGEFLVRIEDTDQARVVEGSVQRQLEAMRWVGIEPSEGVCLDEQGNVGEKGDHGPYTQSHRLDIYKEHAEKLLENGGAYRCFCTPERLQTMREEQQARKEAPRYDRLCRALSKEESAERAASGEKHVIRQAIPENREVKIQDVIRGELTFQSNDLDDNVLLKSDGFPTYQLANVVDDHLMEITHVLRGEEWIPSLPKNALLYESFGWQPPLFAHVPVILGPDKTKLSKRHGAEPVLTYRDRGYLPEAVFNTLAFIGWSPGTEEEFFTKDELASRFQLERVQKSPAVFDIARLDYVNGWYIRRLPVGDVAEKMLPYLEEAGIEPGEPEYFLRVARVVQERLKHFDETVEVSWFFFKPPTVNAELKELIVPKKSDLEHTIQKLREVIDELQQVSDEEWVQEKLEEKLFLFIKHKEYSNMEVLWPIRAALTGVPASPGAFEMLAVLGKNESLQRLQSVL